jgi:hypothetical protein
MEINRAEGGYKNLNQGAKLISQTVNMYRDIFLGPSSNPIYGVGGSLETDLNLSALLNSSDEFEVMRTMSYKYKLCKVFLSFDYALVPSSGMLLNKLVLNPRTDLIDVDEPLYNKNAMVLSMSRNGVKNFWFNLNKGNMLETNVDWIPSDITFPGTLHLSLSSQGTNVSVAEVPSKLGVLKISYNVLVMQKDLTFLAKRMKDAKKKESAGEASDQPPQSASHVLEEAEFLDEISGCCHSTDISKPAAGDG